MAEGFELHVFPCAGKKPLIRWKEGASSDPHEIEAMPWERADAIAAVVPAGHAVLDMDPRHGGQETWDALKARGTLRTGRVAETGGGGRHYWFRADPDLRASAGDGLDVKRAGLGYVLVPPTPGYTWLKDGKPGQMPEWLEDELRAPEHEERECESSDPKFMPFEDGTAYGLAGLERTLGRMAAAPRGGRNEELNKASFAIAQLVAGGELDEDAARERLVQVAERLDLPSKETLATLESGWAAGIEEPRQAPLTEGSGPSRSGSHPDVGTALPSVSEEERLWLDWKVEDDPIEYLIEPIVPRNSYVLVFGPTEASKSMVFVGLGAEASRRGIRTTVYSLENPPHVERDRLRRLDPDPDNFRMTTSPLDVNDPAQFEAMIEREREWGAELVVVDTYSHAFASRSEDGNKKAIEFARRMRYLMYEVGCAVVVIDHTGYAHDKEPRDASAKRQQVDVAVLMTKTEEWRPGQPARFEMENCKSARFGNPFVMRGEIRGRRDEPLSLRWTSATKPKWAELAS